MHSLALLCTGTLMLRFPQERRLAWAAVAFVAGIPLFSGSLYLLALTGSRSWGVITPFGGSAFLLGWLLLGLGVWRAAGSAPGSSNGSGEGPQRPSES
jgi:uncharacterized membrane protein YgdD (TMEM256/DUF423 family)